MAKFCKLYETEDGEQVLVKIDHNEENGNPEVRYYAQPEGLGVCAMALGFDDTDRGWDLAEECFAKVDQERAFKMRDQIIRSATE